MLLGDVLGGEVRRNFLEEALEVEGLVEEGAGTRLEGLGGEIVCAGAAEDNDRQGGVALANLADECDDINAGELGAGEDEGGRIREGAGEAF